MLSDYNTENTEAVQQAEEQAFFPWKTKKKGSRFALRAPQSNGHRVSKREYARGRQFRPVTDGRLDVTY